MIYAANFSGWLHSMGLVGRPAPEDRMRSMHSGILLRSKTVLTVTVNCSRQAAHWRASPRVIVIIPQSRSQSTDECLGHRWLGQAWTRWVRLVQLTIKYILGIYSLAAFMHPLTVPRRKSRRSRDPFLSRRDCRRGAPSPATSQKVG